MTEEQAERILAEMATSAGQAAWLERAAGTIHHMIVEGEDDLDEEELADPNPILTVQFYRETMELIEQGLRSLAVRLKL